MEETLANSVDPDQSLSQGQVFLYSKVKIKTKQTSSLFGKDLSKQRANGIKVFRQIYAVKRLLKVQITNQQNSENLSYNVDHCIPLFSLYTIGNRLVNALAYIQYGYLR